MTRRMIGTLLVIAGIILFAIGMHDAHSFGERVSKFFNGRFTDAVVWEIVGGALIALAGVIIAIAPARRNEKT